MQLLVVFTNLNSTAFPIWFNQLEENCGAVALPGLLGEICIRGQQALLRSRNHFGIF
jgi:hypothetical protein